MALQTCPGSLQHNVIPAVQATKLCVVAAQFGSVTGVACIRSPIRETGKTSGRPKLFFPRILSRRPVTTFRRGGDENELLATCLPPSRRRPYLSTPQDNTREGEEKKKQLPLSHTRRTRLAIIASEIELRPPTNTDVFGTLPDGGEEEEAEAVLGAFERTYTYTCAPSCVCA